MHENGYWVNDNGPGCLQLRKTSRQQSTVNVVDSCLNKVHWLHASRSGNLYFTNGRTLAKVDQLGRVKPLAIVGKHSGTPMATDYYISGLSTDAAENVYVADYTSGQVKKVTPNGRTSIFHTTQTPWAPTGTLMASNGDFWILECSPTNQVRVEKISRDGTRTIY